MTRRSLWISFSLVVLSQLSAGCCTLRPCNWRCNSCHSNGLTPPGAGTSFSPGPLLQRPLLPLLPRPWLNAGYPVGVGGAPMGDMPMDGGFAGGPGGGPGCASCNSSPLSVSMPMGGPMLMTGAPPGGVIASTPQHVPVLNYGPQPAGFSTQPPIYYGPPSTPLPQPKVYPMNGASESPTPMPGQK